MERAATRPSLAMHNVCMKPLRVPELGPSERATRQVATTIYERVRAQPGITGRSIWYMLRGPSHELVDLMILQGLLVRREGGRLYVAGDAPAPRAAPPREAAA